MAKKILIVEDDKFLVRALSDKLKLEGYTPITAFEGEDGLEALRKEKPDLVLLDLVMPKMNGFQFLEEIKNDSKLKATVIVLSNLGQQEDIEKAKNLGAVDYLVKADFSLKEILEKIKKYL